MRVLPEDEFIRQVTENAISKGSTEEQATTEAYNLRAVYLVPEGTILVREGFDSSNIKLHEVGHKVLGPSNRYSDLETGVKTRRRREESLLGMLEVDYGGQLDEYDRSSI